MGTIGYTKIECRVVIKKEEEISFGETMTQSPIHAEYRDKA